MSKTSEILKTEHAKQLLWLDGQIRKNNTRIFVNPKKAIEFYEGLQSNSLIIEHADIEKFMARFLSDSGKKKLITTLRVAETRAKSGATVQVRLKTKNKDKLDYLVSKTGMKKVDIINKLIEMADLTTVTKTEKQLEITL